MSMQFERIAACGGSLLLASLLVLCSPVSSSGQDQGVPESDQREPIDVLIERLDSNRFADRNEATQKLASRGKAAIEALKEAAKSESREVSTRSMKILKGHLEAENTELRSAAKAALESLAEGDDAAARRAADALKPESETPRRPRMAPLQLGAGNIQIQFNANGPNRKMRMRNANGVKEIDVEENGQKIKIVDDPNNGIKVEVTEKDENGNEKTKKYEAKTADDLKQNEPEAYKLYDKYKQANPMGIQIQGIPVQGGQNIPIQVRPAMPIQGRNAARPFRFDPKQAAEEVQAARDELRELIEQSKEAAENESAQRELMEDLADRLEKSEKRLEKAMQNLGPFAR